MRHFKNISRLRIALRLLRRVRDYAQVIKKPTLFLRIYTKSVKFLPNRRKSWILLIAYLSFLNQNSVVPTALDSIASGLGDDPSMLEFQLSPFNPNIFSRTPEKIAYTLGKKYIDSKNDNF